MRSTESETTSIILYLLVLHGKIIQMGCYCAASICPCHLTPVPPVNVPVYVSAIVHHISLRFQDTHANESLIKLFVLH